MEQRLNLEVKSQASPNEHRASKLRSKVLSNLTWSDSTSLQPIKLHVGSVEEPAPHIVRPLRPNQKRHTGGAAIECSNVPTAPVIDANHPTRGGYDCQ